MAKNSHLMSCALTVSFLCDSRMLSIFSMLISVSEDPAREWPLEKMKTKTEKGGMKESALLYTNYMNDG